MNGPHHTVRVYKGEQERTIYVAHGKALRNALLENDLSPHSALSSRINCGGKGHCGFCAVKLEGGPAPEQWLDRVTNRLGLGRVSCQVAVTRDLEVRL